MTTETTTKTTRPTPVGQAATGARDAVGAAAATFQSIASETADRVPEAVGTAREVLAGADRQLRSGSDGMVSVGAALSFGVALGLLIGGSNRLLVAAALVPAGVMALDLYDRASGGARSGKRLQDA